MQKTWEVVFYNYWLDLIRVTYLFYNCLVLQVNFVRNQKSLMSFEKKNLQVCLDGQNLQVRITFLKKEFLIPYYHNKAEQSKNGFEKILTFFTLNWGENTICAFFLSFKTLGYLFALILAKIVSFDIYKHSKVILQAYNIIFQTHSSYKY